MKITVEEGIKKELWDDFVKKRSEANFLQSWDFYEFHKERGRKIVRRVFWQGEKIVAAYAGVVEEAKRGKHLAIAGGPIMLNFDNWKLMKIIFDDMKTQGQKHECVFVRFRPQAEEKEERVKKIKELGAKKAPIYLSVEHAGILDLNKNEAEIMMGARQRLRRAIRKAKKTGIIVESTADPKEIETFYQIQLSTANRHKFIPFNKDFLSKQFSVFAKNNEALIYKARLGEEILAENFMIFYGNEASYHYGVSSELGTKISAAPLLHFAAMEEARKRGIKRYNFWGIVGADETRHRFYGVSEFKRGFGVEELKYIPAQDLVINPLKYKITWLIESLRKKIRRV